ncbi:MAG: hypothetical protein RRY55_06280 [Bacteroidales bacterium]
MKDNRNTAYTILIIISVIGALIILLTGCSVHKTSSSNKITEYVRDTIYIDMVRNTDRVQRDTVVIDNVIIEYLPDSTGNWLPSKKVVSTSRQVGSASEKSSMVDSGKTTVSQNKEQRIVSETKEVKRTSFWWWAACFVIGGIVGVLGIYAIRYFIKK